MDWNKLGHCRAFYLLLFFKEIVQLHSSMIKNYRLNLNLVVTMINLNAAEEKKKSCIFVPLLGDALKVLKKETKNTTCFNSGYLVLLL